jgi:phage terminase large subunit GpA-like protein
MAAPKSLAVLDRIRDAQGNAVRLALRGSFARAYSPPPKMPLSSWADKYRVLSPEAAAMPGRWRTSNEPMAKGVMDTVTNPLTEKVTVMAAAQVLKTEFVLNAIAYYAHGEPGPMLVVYPTVEAAEMFSKERVAPMIRDTPVLRKIFSEKQRDSAGTILQKSFPGGRLSMVGANAPAGLASRPIRFVLCDEVDRYPASAAGRAPKAKATRSAWPKSARAPSPTAKSCSCRRRRPRAFRASSALPRGRSAPLLRPLPSLRRAPGHHVGRRAMEQGRRRRARPRNGSLRLPLEGV